jgi:hypothetical protein
MSFAQGLRALEAAARLKPVSACLVLQHLENWISGSVDQRLEGAPTEEPRPDASNALLLKSRLK